MIFLEDKRGQSSPKQPKHNAHKTTENDDRKGSNASATLFTPQRNACTLPMQRFSVPPPLAAQLFCSFTTYTACAG
jgi:hypothetical protein